MSDNNNERRKWYETYDGREDIDELYQKWCDNENKPKLMVYFRTSKKNQNETNVINQLNKLDLMAGFWINQGWIKGIDGEYVYDKVLINGDVDYSGSCINDNLKDMLSELHFHDDILIYDVSRITRMNPASEDFQKLFNKLFSDYRSVYVFDSGKARVIDENEFLDEANKSYQWYLIQKDRSKKGNEVKRNKKSKRIDQMLILHHIGGYTNKRLASTLNVSVDTIYKYKRELRNQGYILSEPHPNGRNNMIEFNIFDHLVDH